MATVEIETCLDWLQRVRLRKARALLVFLLFTPQRFHRTEKIVDLLWQGDDGAKDNASFRQAVRQIRLALESDPGIMVETKSGLIAIRPPEGWSLEAELTDPLATDPWDPEAAERTRRFLAELDALLGISASLDSWLAIAVSQVTGAVQKALDAQIARAGKGPGAREAAEFALALEPGNEIAVRYLMRLHWAAQMPTRALDLYNALYEYLSDTYDQEPETETVSLLAAIKLDPSGPGLQRPEGRHEERVSMAVMADADPPADPQQAALEAVLVADFRMRLSRFREWQLVDAGAEPYVSIRLKLLAVGTEQDLLVEVSRNPRGELLWSEMIPKPTERWDTKLRPVLMNIANALSIVVADRSAKDTSAKVYDRWLKSQVLLDTWSPQNEGEALATLQSITAEAPKFGPAHAELAGALNVRHVLRPGTRQSEDVKTTALHHALEAVSIDPLDTRAHRVLGWCYCHKGEYELAEFHFDQSLTLNRQNPLTLASSALGFAFTNSLDRAGELVAETRRHADVMEPFHLVYLAAADYLCGNYRETADQCVKAVGLMSTVGGWHTAALQQLGREDEAQARLERYAEEILPIWCGEEAATQERILDWFVSVFPLRSEDVRKKLRATLGNVARITTIRGL